MAKFPLKQILDLACDIVRKNPGGIRNSDVIQQIHENHPELNRGSIAKMIVTLPQHCPDQVSKPSRGLLVPILTDGVIREVEISDTRSTPAAQREEDFYKPFAEWLVNDLDEATAAEQLGGSVMKARFGTPDVVGVYRPSAADLIKFVPEIIAAEIKIDSAASVVAFGQAAAYRLFASKSYVVMPYTIAEEDSSRLDSLCMLYGIGLVLFKPNRDEPSFQIRVRAQRINPDMFYVNDFAERLKQSKPEVFKRLFG